jgi:starch synthase
MKILFVDAEAFPLVRVSGLSDVIGSLPKAPAERGHDARIIIPQHRTIDLSRYVTTPVRDSLEVPVMEMHEYR